MLLQVVSEIRVDFREPIVADLGIELLVALPAVLMQDRFEELWHPLPIGLVHGGPHFLLNQNVLILQKLILLIFGEGRILEASSVQVVQLEVAELDVLDAVLPEFCDTLFLGVVLGSSESLFCIYHY